MDVTFIRMSREPPWPEGWTESPTPTAEPSASPPPSSSGPSRSPVPLAHYTDTPRPLQLRAGGGTARHPPVPLQHGVAALWSPRPGGRRAASSPAATAATLPAPPPLCPPPRPAPLPEPYWQCHSCSRIFCAAVPRCRGTARLCPSRRARHKAACRGAVRYGTLQCGWPQPAAPRRANPGPELSLRSADTPGSQWKTPAGAAPHPVAPVRAQRGAAGPTPASGCVFACASGRLPG